VRWQGGSRDTAFGLTKFMLTGKSFLPFKSGVALRFPPQSKTASQSDNSSNFACGFRIFETALVVVFLFFRNSQAGRLCPPSSQLQKRFAAIGLCGVPLPFCEEDSFRFNFACL
jgi:hypothetical protein